MGLVLFLLLSGDALWIGLALIAAGAFLGRAWPRIGGSTSLVGMVAVLASAVPLPAVLYWGLGVAVAAWLVCVGRPRWERRMAAGLVLVVMLVATLALTLDRSARPATRADPRPVFVLGDSLAAGLGARAEDTWPAFLADQLGRPVQNLARPGAVLADGAMQASHLPPGGCVVLVELGGNDLLGGATAEDFAEGLSRLLRQVSGGGREVVMFELPLLPLQNRYGRAQRRASRELGVRLIPRRVLAGAVAWPGHTEDGLHLSVAGHRWLAGQVARWL